MSQQFFPDVEALMDILMSELPDGVYAEDRADDPNPALRSVSSSELRAHMQVLANLYANLKLVNNDKFISTVTQDGLAPWEKELFAAAQDGSQSYEIRKQNLLAKYRATGTISLPGIKSIVAGILGPVGLSFDILPYSGQSNGTDTGAWVLGVSALGGNTWLSNRDPLTGAGRDIGITPLDCDLDYAAAGLTAQDLADIQFTAYAYEVRIYGNANADTLALLDMQLTALEPARSTHFIRNNASNAEDPGTFEWTTDFLPWWTT